MKPPLARPVASTLALVASLALAGATSARAADAPRLPAGADAAAARISARTLASPIRVLASDLLEGRGPGGRGDQLARA
jgi:outer membrane receptor protein involved in Fe transport